MTLFNFLLSFLTKLGRAIWLPVVFFALFLFFKIIRWNDPFSGIGFFFVMLLLVLTVVNVVKVFRTDKTKA